MNSKHTPGPVVAAAQREEIRRLRSLNAELLEALTELLHVDDAWHGSVNSEMAGARNAARKAIAKATEEST